ncbi:hypothetical protein AAULR_11105, partial [Lacticaseibacillus rhamnosus MTCC 5462]
MAPAPFASGTTAAVRYTRARHRLTAACIGKEGQQQ